MSCTMLTNNMWVTLPPSLPKRCLDCLLGPDCWRDTQRSQRSACCLLCRRRNAGAKPRSERWPRFVACRHSSTTVVAAAITRESRSDGVAVILSGASGLVIMPDSCVWVGASCECVYHLDERQRQLLACTNHMCRPPFDAPVEAEGVRDLPPNQELIDVLGLAAPRVGCGLSCDAEGGHHACSWYQRTTGVGAERGTRRFEHRIHQRGAGTGKASPPMLC